MAMALPLVGALIGGGGAYLAGFTSLTAIMAGASVGWMVGSWAMMSTMSTKNDPIDSGAQEAPRFNSAVRGSQVPIFFGTNRVPAQIVWQANFETIRHDTSAGGGGKPGGSGGGKGGAAPASTSYSYKIDAVYHLGMSPVPLVLISGWLGGDKITDSSLTGISTTGAAFTSLPTTGTVGISYDEAVFFPSDIAEDDTWSWLTSQVGAPIVWPGTAWVGFRGLDLGGSTAMLQLNFEVGPNSGDITVDSNVIARFSAVHAGDTQMVAGVDDQLNTYYMFNGEFRCYDNTGLKLWDPSNADIEAMFAAAGVTHNVSTLLIKVFGDKVLIATTGSVSNNGHAGRLCAVIGVMNTATKGVVAPPTLINWVTIDTGILLYSWVNACEMIDVLGVPYAMYVYGMQTVSGVNTFYVVPTIAEIIAGTYKGHHLGSGAALLADECPRLQYRWMHSDGVNTGITALNHSSAEIQMVPGFGMNIFKSDGTNNPRLYFYENQSMMLLEGNASWHHGIATNYGGPGSLGEMFYKDMSMITPIGLYIWGAGSKAASIDMVDGVIPDNGSWVTSDAAAAIPFDNERIGRALDGGAQTSAKLGNYSAQPLTQYLGSGVWIVVFEMADSDLSYRASFGTDFQAISIRAFLWNTAQDEFTLIGGERGVLVAQGALGMFDWPTNSATSSMVYPDNVLLKYFNGDLYVASDDQNNNGYLCLLGNIDLGATDVTPPYIIKQILVNSVFGIQPGADVIDAASYNTAVTYCETNKIKVSTQYRRAGSTLQAIELLLAIYGGWLSPNMATGKIKFGVMDLQNVPVRTIDNNHLLIKSDGEAPVRTTKGALSDTFNMIRVNFLDRAHDYQNNYVEAGDEFDQDINGPRLKEFPADFVMSPATAQWMADRALWTGLYVRDAHEFKLGWKDSDLEPGDLITLVDSFTSLSEVAQIVKWKESERGVYDVIAVQQVPYVAGRLPSSIGSFDLASLQPTQSQSVGFLTSSGTVVHSGVVTDPSCRFIIERGGPAPTPTTFRAYELPTEFSTQMEVYVGYATDAFAQGANLYISPDNATFANIANVQPHPIAGTFLTDLSADPMQEFAENVQIILHPSTNWSVATPSYTQNVTLNDVTPAGMHSGAGLLYVGSEMVAYTGLTLMAQNHYSIDRLYRGWGGTAIGGHSSGDVWWKHGTGIFAKQYTEDQIGTTFWYKVAPYNIAGVEFSVSSITAKSYTIKGQYQRPASPSTLQLSGNARAYQSYVGSGNDVWITWQDGARKSGFGAGGFGTSPGNFGGFGTDTLSHAWRVEVVGSGSTVVRSTVVSTTVFNYTSSMNFADNGAWRGNIAFKVTAFSPYGDSTRNSVASMNLF